MKQKTKWSKKGPLSRTILEITNFQFLETVWKSKIQNPKKGLNLGTCMRHIL